MRRRRRTMRRSRMRMRMGGQRRDTAVTPSRHCRDTRALPRALPLSLYLLQLLPLLPLLRPLPMLRLLPAPEEGEEDEEEQENDDEEDEQDEDQEDAKGGLLLVPHMFPVPLCRIHVSPCPGNEGRTLIHACRKARKSCTGRPPPQTCQVMFWWQLPQPLPCGCWQRLPCLCCDCQRLPCRCRWQVPTQRCWMMCLGQNSWPHGSGFPHVLLHHECRSIRPHAMHCPLVFRWSGFAQTMHGPGPNSLIMSWSSAPAVFWSSAICTSWRSAMRSSASWSAMLLSMH